MSTWASISETLSYTRISVSQEDLDAAQAMIELFSDVVYNQTADASGAPTIGAKNFRLLKMAVAYQAAWMTDHPDLFTHTDIQSINQDGIFYVHSNENSYLLAPMARRCIKRLSWMRSKTIRVKPANRSLFGRRVIDGNNGGGVEWIDSYPDSTAEFDDGLDWEPM